MRTCGDDPRFRRGAEAPPSSIPRLEPRPATGFHDTRFYFSQIADQLHAMGWPVFPQSAEGKRMPGSVKNRGRDDHGGIIHYKTQYRMHRKMPHIDMIQLWKGVDAYNTALCTGEAWGDFGVFTLDLDILDPRLIERIHQFAVHHFGYNPFIRGRKSSPKIALPYRRPIGALKLPSRFELEDLYEGQLQVIEIGDDGHPLTIYGYHYKDGDLFEWVGEAEPWSSPADLAPMVHEDQLIAFLIDVDRIASIKNLRRVLKKRQEIEVQWADTDVRQVRVPRMFDDMAQAVSLTQGRRAWLRTRAMIWVRMNAGLIAPLRDDGQRKLSLTALSMLVDQMMTESLQHIQYNVNRPSNLTPQNAKSVIKELLKSSAQKLIDGEKGFHPIGTRKVSPVTGVAEPVIGQGILQYDDEFAWLPPMKNRKDIRGYSRSEPDTAVAGPLALLDDRRDEMLRVSRETRAGIMKWLREMSRWDPESNKPAPTLLLKAPTGSGKTTALIQCLSEFKRDYPHIILGPILLLMPSYANISEIMAREDLGIYTAADEKRAAEIIAEAEVAGIRAMIYKGKEIGGCYEMERVRMLMDANVNASGLCHKATWEESRGKIEDGVKTKKKFVRGEDGESKVVDLVEVHHYCRWHPMNADRDESKPACPIIMQQLEVPLCDLVIAPHAFIHTNIPGCLKDVKAVVIDEKIWDKTIGVRELPVLTLAAGRAAPKLTKTEQAKANDANIPDGEKIDIADRIIARIRLCEIVTEALQDDEDLVEAALKDGDASRIEYARWLTGRLQRIAMDVAPDTQLFEIQEFVSEPKGKHLVEEHILWGLMLERLEAREEGLAFGRKDTRIQLLNETTIQMAWRRELNFTDKPIMFLDASGNAELLGKIWNRDIDLVEVHASFHLRVVLVPDRGYAKSWIVPEHDDAGDKVTAKSSSTQLQREAITAIAMAYGDGGVVGGMPLSVRKHLLSDWAEPDNVDSMHYGATRGLDFAKHHTAAFSFGQLELRGTDLDAYIVAVSHDDAVPEMRTDPFGTGLDEHGDKIKRPMVRKEYPLRDGGIGYIEDVFEPQGKWAKIITHQVREEEIAQFGGRLRPVYRVGRAPVWFHFGKVLPAGLVIDEIVSLEDLARPFGRCNPILEEFAYSGVITRDSVGHTGISGVSETALQKAFDAMVGNDRITRAWTHAEFHVKGETEPRKAFIPGYRTGDLLAPLIDAISHLDLIEPPRISREVRRIAFTRRPAPDKVELELAPRADRLAARQEAMRMLDAQIEFGELKYDDKRNGFKVGSTTISPGHLLTHEPMIARIAVLKAERLAVNAVAATTPENMSVDAVDVAIMQLEAETIARRDAARFIDMSGDYMSPVEVEALIEAAVEKAVSEVRRQLGVSVGRGAPANSAAPLPALPENVERFATTPVRRCFQAFRPPVAASAGAK